MKRKNQQQQIGDGVAQLVERRTQDSMTRVRTRSGAQ